MPVAETWLLSRSVSMCLISLGVMHITSEKTKAVRIISLKALLKPLYGIIAGTVVICCYHNSYIQRGTLAVFLMFAMAIACAGQVVLDIRPHPHHHHRMRRTAFGYFPLPFQHLFKALHACVS